MRIKISNTYTSLIQFVKKTASENKKVRAVFNNQSRFQVEQITQALTDSDAIVSMINKRITELELQEH